MDVPSIQLQNPTENLYILFDLCYFSCIEIVCSVRIGCPVFDFDDFNCVVAMQTSEDGIVWFTGSFCFNNCGHEFNNFGRFPGLVK